MTPEAGFVEWAIRTSGSTIDLDLQPFDIDVVSEHRWTEAPILAAVGFRLATQANPPALAERWLAGVGRLMSRDPVPVDRNSFFFSPLALLGLAMGSRSVVDRDDSPSSWLRETINTHADLLSVTTAWSRVLVSIAAEQVHSEIPAADPILSTDPLDIALMLWLHLSNREIPAWVVSADPATQRQDLLAAAATAEPEFCTVADRAIFAIALRDAVLASIGSAKLRTPSAAEFVVRICRRFPLLANELNQRYDKRDPFEVTDEYDVQDLLRAILVMHFSDVRQEEWNPSYGGVQSRSDFLLKPERIVIETKMTRANLGQRQIVDQLAIDKARYRSHPDCGTLICFVYDPGKRLRIPVAIESDLSDHADDLRTLVVVSPQGL